MGLYLRGLITPRGRVQWADNHQSLKYQDYELNLDDFRQFLRLQLIKLRGNLRELLFFGEEDLLELPLDDLDLKSLKDSPARDEIHWSFISDPENKLFRWKSWLFRRIQGREGLRKRFYRNHKDMPPPEDLYKHPELKVHWVEPEIQAYLKLHRRFLARLGLLTLILGGQPPRIPEILSLKVENGVEGPRSVFLEEGLVALITSYHKGYSLNYDTKLIHRYLPPELSLRVVQYLILIRPFSQELQGLVIEDFEPFPYLWNPQNFQTSYFSDFFKAESYSALGERSALTIQPYRHLAIAISRQYMPKNDYFHKAGPETTETIDAQAAHSLNTSIHTYGRLANEVSRELKPWRERYRGISTLWHQFWLDPEHYPLFLEAPSTIRPQDAAPPEALESRKRPRSRESTPPELDTPGPSGEVSRGTGLHEDFEERGWADDFDPNSAHSGAIDPPEDSRGSPEQPLQGCSPPGAPGVSSTAVGASAKVASPPGSSAVGVSPGLRAGTAPRGFREGSREGSKIGTSPEPEAKGLINRDWKEFQLFKEVAGFQSFEDQALTDSSWVEWTAFRRIRQRVT